MEVQFFLVALFCRIWGFSLFSEVLLQMGVKYDNVNVLLNDVRSFLSQLKGSK